MVHQRPHLPNRTRRVIAITCALVVGGAGVSITPASVGAAQTAHQQSEHRLAGKTTAIRPGTLARGKKPQVVHLRKRTLHDGKLTFKLPKGVSLLGKTRRGYLTYRFGRYSSPLLLVRKGAKPKRVGSVGFGALSDGYGEFSFDSSHKRLAVTVFDRSDITSLEIHTMPSGKERHFPNFQEGEARPLAFHDGRIVYGYTYGKGTYSFNIEPKKHTKVDPRRGVEADPRNNLLIVKGGKGKDKFQLVAYDDPRSKLGSWDRGKPLTFSRDGKHLITKVARNKVQVRSTKDGHVVRTFKAADRIDHDSARFETNRTVLLSVAGRHTAANVRCALGGKCKRTTRLEKNIKRLNFDWSISDY